jgi:hypothetical protein
LPVWLGGVQPQASASAPMTCSPRPPSHSVPGCLGAGAFGLGSATAQMTLRPGCSRASRTEPRGGTRPASGSAWRSALVSSSDTTTAMSSQRSAAPHRFMVAMAKSRPARTDRASMPGVRSASLGKQVQPAVPGRADSGQFPLAMAAIRSAGAGH